MTTNRKSQFIAAIAVAAVAGGGAGAGAVALTHGDHHTATVTPPASVSNVASTSLTVGQVAKTATPSVVEVDSTSSGSSSPYPYGGSQSSSAEGTGFVFDTKGDIVTNEHVVDGASAVTVKFSDGSKYKATVVGSDTSTDLAVLHITAPASRLHPLVLADSSAVAVGDGVVAIGNPFGLDGTVTTGIVSALDREISAPDDAPIEGAIQTDAAINHGNSGGPLLNLQGEVIGVTSQIQSESGGSDGVGFAIPSNLIKTIAAQLISSGSVQHALLGVNVQTALNGVTVTDVQSGSAAADAGVKAGDVIASVDGTAVSTAEKLRALIAAKAPGDKVTLVVRRSGASKTLTATLGTRS